MDLLDTEDARILEDEGDLRVVDDHHLLIWKRRFHDRRSVITETSSPKPQLDIHSEDTIQIPRNLESPAAIEFAGFNASTANTMWSGWSSLSTDVQELFSFLHFLRDYIDATRVNVFYGHEQYRDAFTRYGLKTDLIDALMHEEFDDLLHTQSSRSWAKELVTNRYDFLGHGQRASQSRQRQRNSGTAPKTVPSYTVASGQGRVFPGIGGEHGHTLFWKATLQFRAWGMKTPRGPEQLFFPAIVSESPTDFSGTQNGYYFTPQLSAARHYARYYKGLYREQRPVIICVRVPNHLIEGINQPCILRFPSDKFKKVIWTCRNRLTFTSDMMDVKNSKWIIGDTSKGTAKAFRDMPDYNAVSEDNLVWLKNEDGSRYKMTQYYFDEDLRLFLEEMLKQENLTIHNTERPEEEEDINV